MKIEILLNLPKTIDGKPIGPFTAGQICELDDAVAQVFIASAMAKPYVEPVPDSEPVVAVEVSELLTGDGTGEALPEIVEGASNEHESEGVEIQTLSESTSRRARRQAD